MAMAIGLGQASRNRFFRAARRTPAESHRNARRSAVKLGQQLAMRIDLLPYEYTVELSKMLDRMIPFPVEYAILRIENFLGRPLGEVFKEFNPVPIGSASVCMCVLRISGKRRAGGDQSAPAPHRRAIRGGLRSAGLVLKSLEFLTILRPGCPTIS